MGWFSWGSNNDNKDDIRDKIRDLERDLRSLEYDLSRAEIEYNKAESEFDYYNRSNRTDEEEWKLDAAIRNFRIWDNEYCKLKDKVEDIKDDIRELEREL